MRLTPRGLRVVEWLTAGTLGFAYGVLVVLACR